MFKLATNFTSRETCQNILFQALKSTLGKPSNAFISEQKSRIVLCGVARKFGTSSDKPAFALTDPEKGDLVYVGALHKMVKLIKGFSLSTSVLALACQPLLYQQVSNSSTGMLLLSAAVANTFVFFTPVMLHFITKRYVTSIYHNNTSGKDTFTASAYTLLLGTKNHKFTSEDIRLLSKPSIFSTVVIKGKTPLFIDTSQFLDRKAYIAFMKYDEPLDWEIESKDSEKSSQNH